MDHSDLEQNLSDASESEQDNTESFNRLFSAIKDNDSELVSELIKEFSEEEKSIILGSQDQIEDGQTILHWVAGQEKIEKEIIKTLIAEMTREQLSLRVERTDKKYTALLIAVRAKNEKFASIFIDHCQEKGFKKILGIPDEFDQTPLHWTVTEVDGDPRRKKILEKLIPAMTAEQIAAPAEGIKGCYPALHMAVRTTDTFFISTLINDLRKRSDEEKNIILGALDEYGQTALHWSAEIIPGKEKERVDVVKQLIEVMTNEQLKISSKRSRYPALHIAVQLGNLDFINTFINYIKDKSQQIIEYQDVYGFTALHWAVEMEAIDTMNVLLKNVNEFKNFKEFFDIQDKALKTASDLIQEKIKQIQPSDFKKLSEEISKSRILPGKIQFFLIALNYGHARVKKIFAEGLQNLYTNCPNKELEELNNILTICLNINCNDWRIQEGAIQVLNLLSARLSKKFIIMMIDAILFSMDNKPSDAYVKTAVDALLTVLNDKDDADIIEEAIQALVTLGERFPGQLKSVIEGLLVVLKNKNNEDGQRAAIEVLPELCGKLPGSEKNVVDALMGMLNDKNNADVSEEAIQALVTLGERFPGQLKSVIEGLLVVLKNKNNEDGQRAAIKVLPDLCAELPGNEKNVVDALLVRIIDGLLAVLNDKDDADISEEAIQALVTLGERFPGQLKSVIEGLLVVLKNKNNEDGQRAAIEVLPDLCGKLPGNEKNVVDALMEMLNDKNNADVSEEAIQALGTLGERFPMQLQSVIDGLLVVLKNKEDEDVQIAAIEMLPDLIAKLPGNEKGVIDALLAVLSDKNNKVYVRVAAIHALDGLDVWFPEQLKGVIEELSAVLRNEGDNRKLRRTAIKPLLKLCVKLPGSEKSVVDDLLSVVSWQSYVNRLIGSKELDKYLHEDIVKIVIQMMLVSDQLVSDAIQLLGEIGRSFPGQMKSVIEGMCTVLNKTDEKVKINNELLIVKNKKEATNRPNLKKEAIQELVKIGVQFHEGLPQNVSDALSIALKDQDSSVRAAAAEALGKLYGISKALQLAKDTDFAVRSGAIKAFREFKLSLSKENEEVKNSVSDALLEALNDNQLVRQAIQLLQEWIMESNMISNKNLTSERLTLKNISENKNIVEKLSIMLKNESDSAVKTDVAKTLGLLDVSVALKLAKHDELSIRVGGIQASCELSAGLSPEDCESLIKFWLETLVNNRVGSKISTSSFNPKHVNNKYYTPLVIRASKLLGDKLSNKEQTEIYKFLDSKKFTPKRFKKVLLTLGLDHNISDKSSSEKKHAETSSNNQKSGSHMPPVVYSNSSSSSSSSSSSAPSAPCYVGSDPLLTFSKPKSNDRSEHQDEKRNIRNTIGNK
jgi:ankyrin repeat protein/HEAT repeat protein